MWRRRSDPPHPRAPVEPGGFSSHPLRPTAPDTRQEAGARGRCAQKKKADTTTSSVKIAALLSGTHTAHCKVPRDEPTANKGGGGAAGGPLWARGTSGRVRDRRGMGCTTSAGASSTVAAAPATLGAAPAAPATESKAAKTKTAPECGLRALLGNVGGGHPCTPYPRLPLTTLFVGRGGGRGALLPSHAAPANGADDSCRRAASVGPVGRLAWFFSRVCCPWLVGSPCPAEVGCGWPLLLPCACPCSRAPLPGPRDCHRILCCVLFAAVCGWRGSFGLPADRCRSPIVSFGSSIM
jgi:hypothetical protein